MLTLAIRRGRLSGLRYFAAAPTSSTTPTPSQTHNKEPNLFQVVNGLRHFGVGSKVTRSIYKFPDTYWILTRVELSRDQEHGKAWGRLVWRGRPQGKDDRIHSSRKKQWSLVETPDYRSFKGDKASVEAVIKDAEEWFEKHGTWVNPRLKESATRAKEEDAASNMNAQQ